MKTKAKAEAEGKEQGARSKEQGARSKEVVRNEIYLMVNNLNSLQNLNFNLSPDES